MAEEAGASKKPKKYTGILLHPTSLPGPYGIGELGASAYRFVDFLERSGLNTWQVLPLGHTGFGDSPYQPFSAFAGQPLIISLDHLKELHLLYDEDFRDMPAWNAEQINYGELIEFKTGLLKLAYSRFHDESLSDGIHDDPEMKQAYDNFCETSVWLKDYALFMAGKDYHQGMPWYMWEDNLKKPTKKQKETWAKKLDTEMGYYKFIQFLFYYEWTTLKKYANDKGISIVGDIPIFMAWDSVDVWANRELFLLEEDGTPKGVAGSPPDAFSENGQKWGSPVYNWSRMEEDGFAWWQARMLEHAKLFDVIRLDHFAAIVKYYVVPNKAEDGRSGKWSRGPGKKLTDAIEKVIGDTHIIVEDIAGKSPIPGVKKLMARTGWPGIKILMFAFGDDTANEHLPHNYTDCNLVVYAGTHDNETIVGYFRDKTDYELAYLYEYLNIKYKEEIPDALIRAAYASIADVVIIQMQDLMKLGNEARMNAPSTVGRNWRWRIGTDELSEERRAWIRTLASVYHR